MSVDMFDITLKKTQNLFLERKCVCQLGLGRAVGENLQQILCWAQNLNWGSIPQPDTMMRSAPEQKPRVWCLTVRATQVPWHCPLKQSPLPRLLRLVSMWPHCMVVLWELSSSLFLHFQSPQVLINQLSGVLSAGFGNQCLLVGREKEDNECWSNCVSFSHKVGLFSPFIKEEEVKVQ